jgi:hypothetical protein
MLCLFVRLTVGPVWLPPFNACRSNSSSPVQPGVLLEAVKATDDSYEVQLLSRECFDAGDGMTACPAAANGAAGQDVQ